MPCVIDIENGILINKLYEMSKPNYIHIIFVYEMVWIIIILLLLFAFDCGLDTDEKHF